jgi:hypothetical protein
MTILDIIRHSLQSGRCVPIVGAGISIQAGGPSWAKHLLAMADGLSAEFSDRPPRIPGGSKEARKTNSRKAASGLPRLFLAQLELQGSPGRIRGRQ